MIKVGIVILNRKLREEIDKEVYGEPLVKYDRTEHCGFSESNFNEVEDD